MAHQVSFNFQRKLSRRTVLRGAGAAMALPWLSAMTAARASSAAAQPPRRFVAMTLGLGLHADNLFPDVPGADYQPSPYLKALGDIRQKVTVISGTSHPGVSGGHRAEASILTAAPMSASAQSRNTISLDQLLAKHLGNHTRFPSLVLGLSGSNSPSYTENGSMIPAEDSPSRLFTRLFVNDSPAEKAQQAQRSNANSARATAIASMRISPASASWKSGSLNQRRGPTGRSRTSTSGGRSISPTRTISSAVNG